MLRSTQAGCSSALKNWARRLDNDLNVCYLYEQTGPGSLSVVFFLPYLTDVDQKKLEVEFGQSNVLNPDYICLVLGTNPLEEYVINPKMPNLLRDRILDCNLNGPVNLVTAYPIFGDQKHKGINYKSLDDFEKYIQTL